MTKEEKPTLSEEKAAELFFQMASADRKRILFELEKEELRLNEVAKRLGMTSTETLRQLQRLTESSLIQREPEGPYVMTEYGRLVLQLSSSLEFITQHRDYFLTHDVRCLPRRFLDRIGVLANANFVSQTSEAMNGLLQLRTEAREFIWGAGVEGSFRVGPSLSEKVSQGVSFRLLFREKSLPPLAFQRITGAEWRALEDIPVSIVLSEKDGAVSFCLVGGKADYTGFGGSDPEFYDWVKELFLYYWERARRNPSPKTK